MKPIRVLIADDSRTIVELLSTLLRADGRIEVVGTAKDGVEAVELARAISPDMILMDARMPRMDGLQATATLMAERPTRVLIISAVTDSRDVDLSFQAISAGALELISKPRGPSEDLPRWGRKVADAICLMAEVPVVTRRSGGKPRTVTRAPGTVDVVGIVASTGGPPALATVLGGLPGDLPVPILVVQHISFGFATGLARYLQTATRLKIELARAGEPCRPSHVYFAPDGHHLEIDPEGMLQLVRGSGDGHCPSGDRLLTTLARAYGSRAAGVVLTGMGDDGSAGLAALRTAGAYTWVQDEATSTVFGMPGAALKAKAADLALPISAMAQVITDLCSAAEGVGRRARS